ncbi:acetate/propionate family kinase [Chitinimonas sp.]|uniref:acetate/propionate family kinase n=1 Tax=Chitinimonas sp. TaxID=1934313 RepID=UPI0035AFEC4F
MSDAIAVINAGSSSIKFSVYLHLADAQLQPWLAGMLDGIGSGPHGLVRDAQGQTLLERNWPATTGYTELLLGLLDWLETHLGEHTLRAVGHRVVHGGPHHAKPQRVDAALLADLQALVPLAPLHQPHNLLAITTLAAHLPDLLQIACFDTAFHQGMPALARQFALPRALSEQGVLRYGFHGLSYEYIAGELARLDPAALAGRVVVAHLGSGASLCALQGGRSVASSMGFSALDGLMMGSRCGAIDPGVLLYLQRQGMGLDELEDLLYRRSGLLGVSGISSDLRVLLASDSPHAREAIDLFVYRIVREIGALVAVLGGLDALVFTAGIGEHAPAIRAAVGRALGWLGMALDESANEAGALRISTAASAVSVWAIPTDEAAMIARHCLALLRG